MGPFSDQTIPIYELVSSALFSIPLTTTETANANARFEEDKDMIKYFTYDFNFGELEFDLDNDLLYYHIYSTQNADDLMYAMSIPIGNSGRESNPYEFVADRKECGGKEVNKGFLSTVDQCAKACKTTSTMFAYGTNDFGATRCNDKGCRCFCETAAFKDGTCSEVKHNGYRLYRYKPALKNIGQDCWSGCEGVGGICPTGFCGTEGRCCRKHHGNDQGCGDGSLGCDNNHCCTDATGETAVGNEFSTISSDTRTKVKYIGIFAFGLLFATLIINSRRNKFQNNFEESLINEEL